MINIIKKALILEELLRKKIRLILICNFINIRLTINSDVVKKIRITIKTITFLTFNYYNEIFV